MREARYWHAVEDDKVQCDLCPHGCVLAEGQQGLCRVRGVEGGLLRAMSYGRISSIAVDPMEKKPLYHFYPGEPIFSVGGWGCNFRCSFCQNWNISQQFLAEGSIRTPEEIVTQATASGARGIAYTYNEPLVGFEFVYDTCRLARAQGLANVLVTNGYICAEPAADLLPYVDALNVDLKSMDDSFYRSECRGRLDPVLAFCVAALREGCHLEVTNLVIPGLNDLDSQFTALAECIADRLNKTVPLHLSAYVPRYEQTAPPTGVDVLRRAHRLCSEHLKYVYLGNVRYPAGHDTACPQCGEILVRRDGYRASVVGVESDQCRGCGRVADLILA